MKQLRNIVEINEELCNGCGLCVLGCMEGAIEIIDGKAKLVKEIYCDGLGACLSHCPTGALKVIQRKAEAFDEKATIEYLKTKKTQSCLSTAQNKPLDKTGEKLNGSLNNWPFKIHLVSPDAEFLKNADILICADCAVALAKNFHAEYLQHKVLLLACPKLENFDNYQPKLEAIFKNANMRSCTVLRVEVPCCRGLAAAVENAIKTSGSKIKAKHIILTREGKEALSPFL
ncbi:ATP-binding protein [Desulfovibrio litoralis]|uniref:4Fe-4S binding domain-containing protein n=1 Tax=Desulfovibrio litoralis DSM 11393 TaxID=1121455 RepID=A0A1M7SDB4_9BACT|nr:4Fe-4S dicluster domain-containing protein [Desulfovibrio litoralis]SHN56470.1 4Fe-4S binding domain-containing protein [Desulfovibrio litoralis DSM 11393]